MLHENRQATDPPPDWALLEGQDTGPRYWTVVPLWPSVGFFADPPPAGLLEMWLWQTRHDPWAGAFLLADGTPVDVRELARWTRPFGRLGFPPTVPVLRRGLE